MGEFNNRHLDLITSSSINDRKAIINLYTDGIFRRKPSETDSIKLQISPKTPRGKKDSTKRHHHRHYKRQPGEKQFPIQVVTG